MLNLFKKCFQRRLLSLILIGIIVEGIVGFVYIPHVSGQLSITLKWRENAGTGSTWIGPLAADLNNDGLMEIVITGKSGGEGRIAAVDPISGNVIWSQPYGGDHVPCEIIDLNKDDIPEILMAPQYINGSSGGVLALHGNNGSVYWYNPNAGGKGTYIAVADINADGYPEIYAARGGKITAQTYDGNIFASIWTYYPCWGGMTIGDTDFDGVFEVYLAERSESYPSYPSGGRGLRAFWADNLTEIWAHPDILCSSQAPVLADVDKDGDLEIIVMQQSGGGFGVINTDGSVNTYNGIYRKQFRIPGTTRGHQGLTVADVDDDGNLEAIQCGDANHNAYPPEIFDLVDWKLDAKLPFPSIDPPAVADIDGDGKLEIIATNARNVTIFKYNQTAANYDIIYTIPLARAQSFSIVQDIDGDGNLELVFNQFNSWISVYDVEAPAPTPLPRSGFYFYSQYRTREAVYVPSPEQPPRISEILPNDGATSVSVSLSELSFKLTDYQSDPMNYTVTTNPNIGSASDINVPNGKITIPVSVLAPSTTYTWTATATDGTHTTTRTFTFYTEGNVTLTISTVGNGSVTKNPDSVDNVYAYGTHVQLTAVADNIVYKFSRWEGDLAWMGSNNPATILMDGNKTVIAVFTKIEYRLRTYVSPEGSGIITLNNTGLYGPPYYYYYYGEAVQLTAEPNTGWSFSHWENDLTGSQNPATIIMNSSKRVTAVFTQDHYTLTITVIGNGNVTIEPYKTTYTYGENVTLTATADLDWTFAGWSGDVSSNENPITIMMDSNKSIIANFTSANYHTLTIFTIGNGTVNKNPDYAVYAHDENVTLTAIPDAGWKFVEWSGDLTGKDSEAIITMNSSKVVTATFTPLQYTLFLSVNGNGQIIKTPDQGTYAYGTVVTLEAVPYLGWTFTGWGGDLNGTTNPTTIVITDNKTVSATFAQQEYTLSIHVDPPEGGSVNINPVGTYDYGDTVQLEAVPTSGWYFAGWSGDLSGSANPTNITINGDKNVTASFIKIGYTLTINVVGSGSITISPAQPTYDPGTEVTLTANPALGWSFAGWSDDLSGSTSPATLIMDSNKTVTATFIQDQYTLTVNVSPEGAGSVTKTPNQTTYTYGTVVQLTATPEPGYVFSYWTGDISGKQNPEYITVIGNQTVTAVFVEAPLDWWDTAWKYRRTITIDHTKVSGELTDFPVLIEITDSSVAEKAQPDGDDFVFTDANHVKLDHQIELYDNATGHLIAWVKVPYLSSTTDTVLYIYYGNSNCENQQNPTGVWDENYKLVMHLNEETGIHYDSTINGNNGTPFGSLVQGATGYIGSCVEFNGGYIQLPRIFTTETQFTFSAWIYPRSGARYFISQYQSPYQGAFLQVYANNRIELYVNNIIVARSITINRWYYVVATFDGTNARLYVDDGSPNSASASYPIWISQNMYIGDRSDHVRKFNGFIDEVRASNIARSAAWILTEYNNQLNPAEFYTIGPEETIEEPLEENYIQTAAMESYGPVAINPDIIAHALLLCFGAFCCKIIDQDEHLKKLLHIFSTAKD